MNSFIPDVFFSYKTLNTAAVPLFKHQCSLVDSAEFSVQYKGLMTIVFLLMMFTLRLDGGTKDISAAVIMSYYQAGWLQVGRRHQPRQSRATLIQLNEILNLMLTI